MYFDTAFYHFFLNPFFSSCFAFKGNQKSRERKRIREGAKEVPRDKWGLPDTGGAKLHT